MKLRRVLFTFFAIFSLSLITWFVLSRIPDVSRAQTEQATGALPSASQMAAVAVLRLVNTAELRYHEKFHKYGTRTDLLDSGIPQQITDAMTQHMAERGMQGPRPDLSSAEPAPGYNFALYVAADGSHYLAALRDNSKEACAVSFYTDERGLILQAKAIGCR